MTAWKRSGGLTRTGRSRCGEVWRYRMGGLANASTVLLLPGAVLVPDLFFIDGVAGTSIPGDRAGGAYRGQWLTWSRGSWRSSTQNESRPPTLLGRPRGQAAAQCLLRAHPERVYALAQAQTGVRHFVGSAPLTVLRWLLQASPAPVVRWFTWRTWRVLLADIGPDRRF